MIGHGGLLRAFSFTRPIKGSGDVKGSTPRHAQTPGDLGFAVQFNAETPWHFVQLHYPWVGQDKVGGLLLVHDCVLLIQHLVYLA